MKQQKGLKGMNKGAKQTSKQATATQRDKCYDDGKYRMLLSHKQGATHPGLGVGGGGSIRQGFLEEVTSDLRLD